MLKRGILKLAVAVMITSVLGLAGLGTSVATAATLAANPGAATVAGCAGHAKAHADKDHVGLTFWSDSDGCIGTARVTVYEAAAGVCIHNVQLRVYGDGHRDYTNIRHVPTPVQCGGTLTTFFGPHRVFPNPVEVCARAAVNGGGELGPACETVN
jgi:hypothetical protein